jgi:AAHS family 4-hydroxybenzoate transporter-like MFS transporter
VDAHAKSPRTTDSRSISVDTLLNTPPLKPLQYLVIITCALVALVDGMDSQAIGVAAPRIAADLHMAVGRFTPALSAGLLGAAIGAMAFGSIADRYGRRPVLIGATAIFGVFTLLTALPTSFGAMVVLRFIAGLGLGGATPCFITMTADFAPARHRTAITTLQWAAFPLGNAVGGFTNGFVITHSTWHMVFIVAGIPTVLLAVFMLIFLPESLRYLVARQAASGTDRDHARIHRLARRLDPSIGAEPIELVGPARPVGAPTRRGLVQSLTILFSAPRRAGTSLIWIVLYLGFATTTVATLMSPTLLHAAGIGLGLTGTLVGVYSICSMLSMAASGKLVEKFGPVAVLTPAFVVGAGSLAILGMFHNPFLLGCCMVIIGLSAPLGVAGGLGLAAAFYPVEIRSSGVGWGMGVGRFGQVCSPLLIGLMLTLSWVPASILVVMAAAPLLAGLAIALLSWSLKPAAMQES